MATETSLAKHDINRVPAISLKKCVGADDINPSHLRPVIIKPVGRIFQIC